MSNAFKPQRLAGGRTNAADWFGAWGADIAQGDTQTPFDQAFRRFQLPGYGGEMSTTMTGTQQDVMGRVGQVLQSYFGRAGQNEGYLDMGRDILGLMTGMAGGNSPFQTALFQRAGQGNPYAEMLAGFQPSVDTQGLTNFDASSVLGLSSLLGFSPDMSLTGRLQGFQAPRFNIGGGAPNSVSQAIATLMGQSPMAGATPTLGQAGRMTLDLANLPQIGQLLSGTGPGTDISGMIAALDESRRLNLQDTERDLREQFSSMGLRSSTDYANAISQLRGRSHADMMAEVARVIPTITGQRLGGQQAALSFLSDLPRTLTQVGNVQGTLGLGGQSNLINAILGAGNLGLGMGQQDLTRQIEEGKLNLGAAGIDANVSEALARVGLDSSQQGLDALNSAVNAGLQAKGLNLESLRALASVGIDTSRIVSEALQSAGGLFGQNNAQGLDAITNLIQSQIGAAGQGTQSVDVLSRVGQALATGDMDMLTRAFQLGEGERAIGQSALDRAYNEWVRQQGGFPMFLNFMSGAPGPDYGPSPFSQAMQGVTAVASAVGAGKAMK